MSLARVYVVDFLQEPLDVEREILAGIASIEALDAHHEAELVGKIEDADALLVYHFIKLTQVTIERLKKCRLIVRCGAGFDNVDWKLCRQRGIDVANVPDYGTEDVADTAIGLMLSLTRGSHLLNQRSQRSAGQWSYTEAAPLHRLRGKVFGIIGIGSIGAATALRAKAFGMDVVYYDPYAVSGRDKSLGVRCVDSLEALMHQSYVVSCHCPLTDETRGIINATSLSWMPKGSYLVNTSRGAVVDSLAVLRAIEAGQMAGAALDVLPVEPPLESDPLIMAWRNPLHPAHDRVIITPHAAFYCEEGIHDMRTKGCLNVRRVLQGLPARERVQENECRRMSAGE